MQVLKKRFAPKNRPPFDRVTFFASTVGLLAFLGDWFTVRPNRLAPGAGMELVEAAGPLVFAVLLILWHSGLIFSFNYYRRGFARAFVIMSVLLPSIILFLVGGVAQSLAVQAGESGRVSVGVGLWVALAAAFLLASVVIPKYSPGAGFRSLAWLTLVVLPVILVASGWLSDFSVLQEIAAQGSRFRQEALNHVRLTGIAVLLGTIIGIPFGIWAFRSQRANGAIFFVANITQTVPSLALFGLLIAPLSALSFAFPVLRDFGIRGIGATPALIALTIYSLLPIIRNTFVSLDGIDPAMIDAGRGMGMSRTQIFRRIQAPLAAPLVMEGVRISAVQAVGNTAVAALIGAGGLGFFIFQGLGQAAADLILAGAIPIILLALLVDTFMRLMVAAVKPHGARL